MRIIKYEDALDLLGVKITEENISKLKYLEKEGYTEKGICYGICRSQIKIMSYRGDKRFWNILFAMYGITMKYVNGHGKRVTPDG